MKRISSALLLTAFGLAACSDTGPVQPNMGEMVAPTTAASQADGFSLMALDATSVPRHMISSRGALSDRAVQEIEALGGTVVFTHQIGFSIVDGLSDEAAAQLPQIPGVNGVDLDVTIERDFVEEYPAVDSGVLSPSDAFFYQAGYQWNMDAVGAPAAWAAGRTGSREVTVAILDSGLDDTHLDLVGLVDAGRSRSFLPAGELDYLIGAILFPSFPDYADFNSHGTHVGATVASNGVVGAGITDNVTLMAVKVCRWNNSCSGAAIIAGILHAADSGADVANMSLGGSFSKSQAARDGFGGFVGFLNRTYNYARRQGMIIVVSAGNSSVDLDRDQDGYKTYCDTPATVCIAATGPKDTENIFVGPFFDINTPATYTNFGRSAIDLAAPGGDFAGFVWAACSSSRVTVSGGRIVPHSCTTSKGFITGKAGTSMSAPHVSGLAALLVEDYGRNPGLIQNRMQQTADDLGPSGTDRFYGKGFINVPRALGIN
jgi:lantibiotic leader peptide-processing serine protease